MMSSTIFLDADPLITADRLEALAADLRSLAAGEPPQAERLATAPILDDWRFGQGRHLLLVGRTTGHPVVSDGRTAMTSAVYAFDPQMRWARTVSRFFRLGPANEH